MWAGDLSAELLALLPPELVEAYELESLFVGTYADRMVWLLRTASGWMGGPLLEALFTSAVDATWSQVYSGTPPDWTA